MTPFRLTRRADEALDAIASHIAADNPAAAKRVAAALYEPVSKPLRQESPINKTAGKPYSTQILTGF